MAICKAQTPPDTSARDSCTLLRMPGDCAAQLDLLRSCADGASRRLSRRRFTLICMQARMQSVSEPWVAHQWSAETSVPETIQRHWISAIALGCFPNLGIDARFLICAKTLRVSFHRCSARWLRELASLPYTGQQRTQTICVPRTLLVKLDDSESAASLETGFDVLRLMQETLAPCMLRVCAMSRALAAGFSSAAPW